jgi:hypothetical protein
MQACNGRNNVIKRFIGFWIFLAAVSPPAAKNRYSFSLHHDLFAERTFVVDSQLIKIV